MSLLVTALVVGCGALVGRLLVQRPAMTSKRHSAPEEEEEPAAPQPEAKDTASLEGFPCQLGDVVLRNAGGDEAWLAGAVVLSESAPVAVLFISPEAGAARAVLARPGSDELLWLTETTGATILAAGEPATTLELEGEHFERKRRLPLRVERRGTGAPDLGSDALFAEYTGLAGSALVVLVAGPKVHAYRGELLPSGTYDVLPRPT